MSFFTAFASLFHQVNSRTPSLSQDGSELTKLRDKVEARIEV